MGRKAAAASSCHVRILLQVRYLRKYGVPARQIDGASRPTYSILVPYVCTRLREAIYGPSTTTTRWEEDSKGPHPIWGRRYGVLRIVVSCLTTPKA